MLNEKNVALGQVRSVIRELFEYGKQRKSQIGEENVYDFSLGNPSVPTPEKVTQCLQNLVANTDPVQLHGYTSAQGDLRVRQTIAKNLSKDNVNVTADNIYMTCGAAASLTITLNAILNAGEEVITFAPFFPEYRVFCEHAGGKLVVVPSQKDTFQIDFDTLKCAISPKTKAIIINSPNNPSGVVYSKQCIQTLCALLTEYAQNKGQTIYLISDEPYRELVYGGAEVPNVMQYYTNSIICYSYSKSLSLPGERIGYIAVHPAMQDGKTLYAAVCGAGRALGYVCAPNLFQQLVAQMVDVKPDVAAYQVNRDLLYGALTSYGYQVVKPDGAFYLFVKSPEPDALAFAERAKQYELLIVPSNDFGCQGYVRIAYCVSYDMIKRSLPAFEALIKSYQ